MVKLRVYVCDECPFDDSCGQFASRIRTKESGTVTATMDCHNADKRDYLNRRPIPKEISLSSEVHLADELRCLGADDISGHCKVTIDENSVDVGHPWAKNYYANTSISALYKRFAESIGIHV